MQQLSAIPGRRASELMLARLIVDFDIRNGNAAISHFRTEQLFVTRWTTPVDTLPDIDWNQQAPD